MSAGYKTQLSVYFNRKKRLKEKKRSVCTAGLTGDKVKDYSCQAETCRSIDGWMKWKVLLVDISLPLILPSIELNVLPNVEQVTIINRNKTSKD